MNENYALKYFFLQIMMFVLNHLIKTEGNNVLKAKKKKKLV